MVDRNRILDGVRMVEGSAFIAAPLAGMTLAQMGAEVVRFDPPGGGIDAVRWPVTEDGESLYWAGLNKGKRSIALDVKTDEGREVARRLIAEAGIFITNFPASGWTSYDALKSVRDDLIMVHLVGNPDGSAAVDYTVNCAMGFPTATGTARPDQPINHLFPAWDAIAGVLIALAVVTALRHREHTGEGQYVRLSLADAALWMVGNLGYLAEVQLNDSDRKAYGNHLYGAFGRDFGCADGRRVMVTAITNRQWRALVEVTGTPEKIAALETAFDADFHKEGDRFKARDAIAAVFEPWFDARDLATVGAALDAAGVLWGPYRSFRQLVEEDPRCTPDNPMMGWIDPPHLGRHLAPGAPLAFSAAPTRGPVAPPRLGDDTAAVLRDWLGLDPTDPGVAAGTGGKAS